MKKFVTFVLVSLMIAGVLTVCAACNSGNEPETNHISYMQQTFYCGGNLDFVVRLIGGTSEALFVADGQTVGVAPFTTMTLIPQHVDLFNEDYTYTLVGDAGELENTFVKDSFGASYTADIADIAKVGVPTTVRIRYGEKESTIELKDMLADSIGGVKAMEIAEQHLADKLTASDKEREIYVKYINDAENSQSSYYWYVAFIASPTDYYAVLVDNAGQIVSVNP